MADSFFGFNTTLPMDDDGGGDLEPPEEDYDALNDETFGDAREGDWEDLHENLVRMSSKEFPSSAKQNGSIKSEDDDDLDFSRFNFDDLDMGADDNDIKVQLDPSVWAAPSNLHQQKALNNNFDPNTFLRQHFSQPQTLLQQHHNEQMMQQHNRLVQQQQQQQQQQQESQTIDILATLMKQAPKPQAPLKFVSVDELERNILMQQQQNKQQAASQSAPKISSAPQKVPGSPAKGNTGMPTIQPPPGMGSPRQYPMYSQVVQQQLHSQQQQQQPHPMANQGKNNRNFPQMPPQMIGPARPPNIPMPPGVPGANGAGLSRNMPPINMGPHPMNNFGPFGPMRGGPMPGPAFGPGVPPGMRGPPPPGHPLSQFYNQNQQTLQNSVKQFNMNLMEEIKQNHPMLQQLNRMHAHGHHHMPGPMNPHQNGHHGPHHMGPHQNNRQMQQQMQSQHAGNNNNANKHHSNGNFRQEPQDPYANLMSNRDKQWLISIQLMQLNTETPYFDDFYFTVFKEKKAKGENRAYNNNQLNHPFNQGPKGHAHNMLMQAVANKNGMNNNNRNGMHNRERKNSESQSGKNEGGNKETGRNYTPLQFENSLGKLQVGCGSVTAPRKIIDMEVVSAEPINTAAIIEINTQRKSSRTLLLHIETLYKVLLLLEDLENPVAIAAAQILKQKREKERQQALEQAAISRAIAMANGEEVSDEMPTLSLPSDKYPVPQTHDELIPKLLAGLTPEKVTAMMTVRKGKALLRRSMPLIKDEPHRWTVWCAIFASLNIILKKEKEVDPNVMALHEEFQKHLHYAKLENVIQVSRSFVTPDKKMNFLFNNKTIGLSTIIAMILHTETLYSNPDYTRSDSDEKLWEQFLSILTTHAANIEDDASSNSGIQTMDSQVLKNIIQHLTRFASLQTKPLLNILTQVDSK